ncbi:WcaG Nucleoside-diphosphate-sugar epimerases [Candidatus Nanopelagicaceae bacterium]
MKVLVVGSSGFVGSNMNLVLPDVQFFGLDVIEEEKSLNSCYQNCVKMDFLSGEATEFIGQLAPECVVLLAGIQFTSPIQKRKNRESAFSQNLKLAQRASELLSSIPTIEKLIYISTDMVYGIQQSEIVDEGSECKPIGEYGKSKLRAEEIIEDFSSRVVIFRPRLIVGPGRVGTIKLISRLISAHLPIPFIGRGENRYQMISVFDLWSAISHCLSNEVSGIFNLGSSEPPTLNELFPRVLRNLGRKNRIIRLPRKLTEKILLTLDYFNLSPLAPEQFLIAGQNCVLSTKKFMDQTGWAPQHSDEEMITQVFRDLT